MSTKMNTFDIFQDGKKVGQQTHSEEFAPVLQSGQTAKLTDVAKVKAPEPSVVTAQVPKAALPASMPKGR